MVASNANRYTSAALETTSLVTGAVPLAYGHPATLLGLLYDNYDGYQDWVQIFDGYQQPSTGSVPLVSLRVFSGSQGSFGGESPTNITCVVGIVVVLSSTGATYTPVTNKLFTTAFWS